MKRIVLSTLLLISFLISSFALGEAFPDASAYCKAEDIIASSLERCSMTLQLQDGVNTITRPGTYLVQGNCNGQLIVDIKDAEVYLLLDGVSITSPDGPAVYIKSAEKVVITLQDGTESVLIDSASYTLPAGEEEPNGVLFSKEDLSINGTGTLRVIAQYDDGIVSKDSLVIAHSTVMVESRGDGIRGKDSVMLHQANVTVTAGNDGMKSTNAEDAGRGWIYVLDSSLTINAQHDGIQTEADLYLNGGMYSITSGGGCLPEYRQQVSAPVRKADRAAQQEVEDEIEEDTESGKGLKAADIHVRAGMFIISSRDDTVHADGSIVVHNGYFELASNDDGIHADNAFTLHDGHIVITESYEGIEAAHILLAGGKTEVTAIDDGWNAASKAISRAEGRRRKKSHDFDITVSGGEHHILAGADAIDSNGNIFISGGITYAFSSNEMKEVPIDYPEICECRITGGTVIASGGYGKNTQTFSHAENQAAVTLKWKEQQPSSTEITLLISGQQMLTFMPKAAFKTIIVSTPDLQMGQQLTVQTSANMVCTREITESIMLYQVTQSKRTGKAAQTNPPAVESSSVSYGSMTAYPASGNSPGYWFYTPDNAGQEPLPLIVYLHGGSGKGSNLTLITQTEGFPQYVQEGRLGDIRAYVLCPQCPSEQSGWQNISDQVLALIDIICESHPIDREHIILTGHSMGGTGTWALAALSPQRFSCIVPMSGSVRITRENQKALSELSIWAFVAENDKVVDPAFSTDFVAKLNEINPDAKLTVFDGAGHRDVPSLAWLDKELGLIDWMLSQ